MKDVINIYNKIAPFDEIKVEPFDINKRHTKPHRHNKYLEIIYFTKGEGFHHIDSIRHPIKPPMVFIVKKEQVHNWEINNIPKGYVIIVKEAFLDKTLDKYINIQLNKLKNIQKVKLQKKGTSLRVLFKLLSKELKQPLPQIEFVEGVLKALLEKIISHDTTDKTNDNVSKLNEFMEFLAEKPINNVTFYANSLNITSQNLNQLCKKAYNKTSSEIIAIEIIKEAKRFLIYTNQTISEIAFKLDFKDVSHFVKYFKRYSGYTPLQFRKLH